MFDHMMIADALDWMDTFVSPVLMKMFWMAVYWYIASVAVSAVVGACMFLYLKWKKGRQKTTSVALVVANTPAPEPKKPKEAKNHNWISTLAMLAFMVLWVTVGPGGTLAILLCLALIIVVLAIAGLVGAESNMWFCYVRDGTIKTVVAGEKFVRFIVNVKGYYYDEEDCKIKKVTDGEDKVNPFTELTGLYLISLLWPLRRIFKFDVLKKRLRSDRENAKTIAEQIDLEKQFTTVDNLRWRIERPFYLSEVDMANNERADFLVKGVFIVESPYKLIFEYGGKFFDMLDSIVIGYTLGIYRGKDFNDIDGSEPKASALNDTDPNNKFNLRGIVGLITDSLTVEEFSLSPVDTAVQEALQAKNVAKLKGEAKIITKEKEAEAAIAEARGQKKALELVGKGEGARFHAIAQSIKNNGGSGAQIGQVAIQDSRKYLKDLRGTLVEGGSNTPTTLALSSVRDGLEEIVDNLADTNAAPQQPTPPPAQQPTTPNQPNQPGNNQGRGRRRRR